MIKDLIKLANKLDEKGLRKEADELDRIIKKYAEEAPDTHPGRQFVLNRINRRSRSSEDNDNSYNPINLFRYEKSEKLENPGGIILGLGQDHIEKMTFDNAGSGSKSEKIQELEERFPGITSSSGCVINGELDFNGKKVGRGRSLDGE